MNRSVSYDPAESIQVAALPNSINAGASLPLQITMLASDGRLAVDYEGTLVLSSSDTKITLSSEITLGQSDSGYKAVSAIFRTAGTQTITLQDSKNSALKWNGAIVVKAATLSSLSFKVGPTTQVTLSKPIPIEITAADSFGNPVDNSVGSQPVQLNLASTNSAALGGTSSGILSGNVLTLAPTVDKIGTGYTFTASILGSTISSATSSTFAVIGPSLTLAPATLNFGTLGLGTTSSALIVTLTNSGNLQASSCSAASLSGTNSSDFSIASDGCGTAELAASASCTVSIVANPTATGTRSATLSRTCTMGGTVSTTSGGITATSSGASLAFTPTGFDFRKIQLRSPNASSAVFTLSNSGLGTASSCSAPTLSGNQSSEFIIDGDGCGTASMAASSSCTVTVRPSPQSTGSRTATLSRVCTTGGTASTTSDGIQVTGARFRPKFVSTGREYACALLGDGSVVCWGANSDGQLGRDLSAADLAAVGDSTISITNITPVNLGLGKTAVAISSGRFHACAILNDGSLKCWGNGGAGALGQDSTANVGCGSGCTAMRNLSAINLGTGRKAIKVAAGWGMTCAVLDNGTAKCWGGNTNGMLGYDSTTSAGCGADGGCTLMANLPAIAIPEPTFGKVIDIAVGIATTTCALMSTGTVVCWGSNTSGQLGIGSTVGVGCGGGCTAISALSAADVASGAEIAAKTISVGNGHVCVTRSDGTGRCWGGNGSGQLGVDSTVNSACGGGCAAAANANSVTLLKDVKAGDSHTCALDSAGRVWCWGANANGQLGYNDTNRRGDGLAISMLVQYGDTPVVFKNSQKARQISTYGDNTCALLERGEIQCWGPNTSGTLGIDNSTNVGCGAGGGCTALTGTDTINLGTDNRAVKVETSGTHSCALMTSGEIYCWGRNSVGQLGLDHTNSVGGGSGSVSTLSAVNLGSTTARAADVSVNRDEDTPFTCMTGTGGNVRCWGANESGQLGRDNTTSVGGTAGDMGALSDIALAGGGGFSTNTVIATQAGGSHTCAIGALGDLICWGKNNQGQLGHNNTTYYGAAAGPGGGLDSLTNVFGGGNVAVGGNVLEISSGINHTCAILKLSASSGTALRCYGQGAQAQLGGGNLNDIGSSAGAPTNMASITSVAISSPISVAAGGYSSCAISGDHSLRCWGSNGEGQLGIDSSTSTIGGAGGEIAALSAISVGSGSVLQAAISSTHACAITTDHAVRCWGNNAYGQLGQDNTTSVSNGSLGVGVSSLSAINLGTDRTAINVSTGRNTTCAVLDNGEIKCWGDNQYGQLGIESSSTTWGASSSQPMSALDVVKLP